MPFACKILSEMLHIGDNVKIADFTIADEQECAYGKHKSMG